MRITILSFFSGLVERGVEVYVDELSRRLKDNFQIEIIQSSNLNSPSLPYSGKESIILRRLFLDLSSWQIKQATQDTLKHLEENPPDILYPVNNGWQSLLCKKFCSNHKTKLLLAGHSGPGWDDRVNLWLKPDIFICFSKHQQKWVKSINRGVKTEVIPHSVDLTKFSPKKRPNLLKLPKPIFVSVSALSPQDRGGETNKNIDSTIKAIAKLKAGSFLLIGKGEDQTRIDKLAKSLLGSNRYQRLTMSHNIIHKYYQATDVFTLASSTSESFGLVYLEAMACGLPVVATDDSLRREIIGPAGVFIKSPQDIQEYSHGLLTALKKKWGNTPRAQSRKFSWKKAELMYQKLFRSL